MPKRTSKTGSELFIVDNSDDADKFAAYLHHEMTLAQLVDWAEIAMMDGELADCNSLLQKALGSWGTRI